MKTKKTWIIGLAIGLLALGGWKAFSYFKAPPKQGQAQQWICPMRCLNRAYDKAGDCDVCHMKLKAYSAPKRTLLGYQCPLHRSEKVFAQAGACPFCGLQLKAVFDGPKPPQAAHTGLRQWPLLEGKTAVYFRPYEVRTIAIEKLLRGAGPLQGLRMRLRLAHEQTSLLRKGSSAMVMPPQGYARPVQAVVRSVSRDAWVTLELSRPIPGVDWALAELRVELKPALAVPLAALLENGPQTRIFVIQDESFEPRTVTVTARGESYALVQGLAEGEVVAGAGSFWLDAQWRMEHP